jgi:hypothetical protein
MTASETNQQDVEQLQPDAFFRPPHEAIVEFFWAHIPPGHQSSANQI